jgi:large subunit ribosomal protein L4
VSAIDVKDLKGATAGTVDLDDEVFGIQPNVPVMHQVVTAQLAARRAGSQSTLTRAEVRGGGAKPWRQKGTGRSRQGSSNSPQWRGGGIALGPKPRSFAQRTPKKMIKLALRSALSDRATDGKVVVVDGWDFDAPKTKSALAALEALGVGGRVLVVLPEGDEATWKSFRTIGWVHTLVARELNAYDVLCSDWVVFTKETLPTSEVQAPEADGQLDAGEQSADEPAEATVAISQEASEAAHPPGEAADATEPDAEGSAGEGLPSGASVKERD